MVPQFCQKLPNFVNVDHNRRRWLQRHRISKLVPKLFLNTVPKVFKISSIPRASEFGSKFDSKNGMVVKTIDDGFKVNVYSKDFQI